MKKWKENYLIMTKDIETTFFDPGKSLRISSKTSFKFLALSKNFVFLFYMPLRDLIFRGLGASPVKKIGQGHGFFLVERVFSRKTDNRKGQYLSQLVCAY